MNFTSFLDILLLILFLLSSAGLISAVLAVWVVKTEKPTPPIQTDDVPGTKKSSRVSSRSSLSRSELEELLFELEREKRTVTLGFSKMTDTHQEVAKARVEKIEARLQRIKTQLAGGI